MKYFFPDCYYFRKPFNIRWLCGFIVIGIQIAYIIRKIFLSCVQENNPISHLGDKGVGTVRSTIINKMLSFQYRLGKLIGRKRAGPICIFIERTFTSVFGREVYWDGK